MSHLLYLMFRCDFDVMESLIFVGFWDLNGALVNQALLCINPKCETTAGGTGLFCKKKEKFGVPANVGFAEAIDCYVVVLQTTAGWRKAPALAPEGVYSGG